MAVIMPHSAFIHIPKTGGTWCRAAIDAARIPHFESGPNVKRWLTRTHASITKAAPTIFVRNWIKKDMRPVKRLTFAVVRNPWRWLESAWADATRKGCPPFNNPKHWLAQCYSRDFTKYIANIVEREADVPSRAFLHRLGFHRRNGPWEPEAITIDEIGHNETLTDDFIRFLKKAGERFNEKAIRAVAPQRVSGGLQKYRQHMKWTPQQRQRIYDANQFLCDTFGYSG